MVSPNERSGVDVGRASLFAFLRHWPAASERRVRLKYMQYSSATNPHFARAGHAFPRNRLIPLLSSTVWTLMPKIYPANATFGSYYLLSLRFAM